MGSLRTIREQARREKREAKQHLISQIDELMELYGRDRDYLARIVDELNARHIVTLNGMTWTTRNLWQFLATNEASFEQVERAATLPAVVSEQEVAPVPPQDLDHLLTWARQYRKYGVIPVIVKDPNLLEQVEATLEEKNVSFSDLINGLLQQWLNQDAEHRPILPEAKEDKSRNRATRQKTLP